MLQSWILDLIIKDGKTESNCPKLGTGIWLIVSADGIPRPFSTNESTDFNNPSWNFPVRIILHLIDLHKSYLYFTLCTKDPKTEEIICVGRSRIGLRFFPFGSPKTIDFPVMQTDNASKTVLLLRITASLSNLEENLPHRNNYLEKIELLP